jgi:hypothetical protein
MLPLAPYQWRIRAGRHFRPRFESTVVTSSRLNWWGLPGRDFSLAHFSAAPGVDARYSRMGAKLTLRYARAEELEHDFESNLRKGRAFVPGASGLPQRAPCTLHIEHPAGGAALDLQAEAVWTSENPDALGVGLELVNFNAEARDSLRAFVASAAEPPRAVSGTRPRQLPLEDLAAATEEEAPESELTPIERNLHDRVRSLSLADRDTLARQGNMPERVALERRYGGSLWEALLQNPAITTREVCRMAKSGNLPTGLVTLIVSNAGWLADPGIRNALLQNPRVSGLHLERLLRSMSQNDLAHLSENSGVRLQVRQSAKRLIRR